MVYVETIDNTRADPNGKFKVELQNPQGAKVAAEDSSTITRIIDNDVLLAPIVKAG